MTPGDLTIVIQITVVSDRWLGLQQLAEREGFYYRRFCYLAVMPTLPR